MGKIQRGLIVSCQATDKEPLYNLDIMKYFAKCAVLGGAVAIRALADEIVSIKSMVNVPVIGLVKKDYEDSKIYITPTKKEIDILLDTNCDVIAMDATLRARPNGESIKELVDYAKRKNSNIELFADCSTLEECLNAEKLGFDYIGTTLRGYTENTVGQSLPDFEFIKQVTSNITKSKIIAEGGIWTTDDANKVSALNPHAIVIGTAITRPMDIVKKFNQAIKLS